MLVKRDNRVETESGEMLVKVSRARAMPLRGTGVYTGKEGWPLLPELLRKGKASLSFTSFVRGTSISPLQNTGYGRVR